MKVDRLRFRVNLYLLKSKPNTVYVREQGKHLYRRQPDHQPDRQPVLQPTVKLPVFPTNWAGRKKGHTEHATGSRVKGHMEHATGSRVKGHTELHATGAQED